MNYFNNLPLEHKVSVDSHTTHRHLDYNDRPILATFGMWFFLRWKILLRPEVGCGNVWPCLRPWRKVSNRFFEILNHGLDMLHAHFVASTVSSLLPCVWFFQSTIWNQTKRWMKIYICKNIPICFIEKIYINNSG